MDGLINKQVAINWNKGVFLSGQSTCMHLYKTKILCWKLLEFSDDRRLSRTTNEVIIMKYPSPFLIISRRNETSTSGTFTICPFQKLIYFYKYPKVYNVQVFNESFSTIF